MSEEKLIEISGTSNRYLINKLKKEKKEIKHRKITEKMSVPAECFSIDNQMTLITKLYNADSFEESKHLISQLESKLTGYKHQDIIKKRYNIEKFIQLKEVIDALYNCETKCYYCCEKTFILYDLTRELKQWTLDRINNDVGHNSDNVIISCLECNLKRRKQSKDAFLFTKQLNIVKS